MSRSWSVRSRIATRSSSVSVGSPIMKYSFRFSIPLAKIISALARISSLVIVLLMTRRSRSEPVSGAIVSVRSPLPRRRRTMVGVRSSSRSEAGLIEYPMPPSRVRISSMSGWSHSAIDTRPARLEYGPRSFGQLQDAVLRKRAHGQVVVPGPAEAAQVGAAANDFDQKADPNSVSGVKMVVAGGSTASVVLSAALRTTGGAPVPVLGTNAAIVPSSA